jgi:raffinose/stachyose/melibiose transport system substrate-binding protein
MRMKPWSFLLAVVFLFSIILTACSGKNETSKSSGTGKDENASKQVQVTITYATGDPADSAAKGELIKAFQQKYPNIKFVENNSGTGSYLQALQTKDAVGEFPDFVEMRDTQVFADAGKIAPIPEELESLFATLPEINGKHYVAPIVSQAPQGIIYNKKIFKDLGLDEPKNLSDFFALSQKIKKSGISPLVVGGGDLWHMGFLINKFLIDNVYAQNPNWNSDRANGKVHFSDENVVKAITDLKKLWDKGLVDKGWSSTPDNQTTQMLISGKAAMLYSGTWMFQQIQQADPNFEIGFFAIPDENGKIALSSALPPQGWAISADAAKDQAKVDAFKKFVEFYFSKDQYASYLSKVSGIASTKEQVTYDAIAPMKTAMKLVSDPNNTKTLMINQFYGDNQIPPQFRDWFYKTITQTLSGQLSVKEAMQRADTEWETQYKAWKKQ